MRGMGVPPVRGGSTGDLLCKVMVETPINLNQQQKELLREFDQTMSQNNANHSPRSSTWFNRVKKFFEDMKF
jgi:molecular chaperone DnaJ